MTASRGWTLALAAASVLCLVLLYLTWGIGPRAGIGAAIIVAFAVLWALTPGRHNEHGRWSVALVVVVTVVAAGLATVESSLSVFQAFAIPLVWTLLESTARSIVATTVIVIAVGAGFVVGTGGRAGPLAVAAGIQSVVLVFSIAMGLWISQIARLSDDRRRLLEQLTTAQDEVAALHRDAGAIAERERFARELHDTIAQDLTGLVMLGQRSRRELAGGTLDDGTLAMIETGARDALTQTRSLVAETARVELPGGGLAEALSVLGDRVQRESGIRIEVTSRIGAPIDRDAEVVLLRCVQEGLANVRKHADATTARVDLIADAGSATVRVIDDGQGFDPSAAGSAGFGLSGLRDRLRLVGGDLDLDGTPGSTTLTAQMPLAGGSS